MLTPAQVRAQEEKEAAEVANSESSRFLAKAASLRLSAAASRKSVTPTMNRKPPTDEALERYACASALGTTLRDCEVALADAWQHVGALEDVWSAAEADAMQKNSQMRMEARQSERMAKAKEKAIVVAQQRVQELEQALTDAALRSERDEDDELEQQLVAPRSANKDSSNTVESLGDGHGGVDLGGARHLSSPEALSLHNADARSWVKAAGEAGSIVAGGPGSSASPGFDVVPTGGKSPTYTSPPKLTLEETAPMSDSQQDEFTPGGMATPKPLKNTGGCCIVS